MRKKALLALACLMLSLCAFLPMRARAGVIDRLYVWDASLGEMQGDTLPGYAVQWYKRGSAYYLLLPTGMDAGNLRVYFTGYAKYFTCEGEKVQNGGVTGVFVPGTTVTICNGSDSYDIRVMQSANIASVHIKTESGGTAYIAKSKANREGGSLFLITQDGRLAYDKPFDYIRVRGNYSFYPNKKSYHIKLESGFSMLGMGKAKTWLLIANYKDCSLLRNAITLDMAAAAGLAYTSQYRFVDVYMNYNYVGNYLLAEKIQVGENRVDIRDLQAETEELNKKTLDSYKKAGVSSYKKGTIKYRQIAKDPKDITGGYLMQLELADRYKESSSGFITQDGQTVQIKEPELASKKQVEYISALVQSFESAISAADGVDPLTGKHYTQIADMDSLVRKYLVEEISKNLDANKSSFFVYKPADAVSDQLFFGPVWDFDNAYGVYSSSYYKRALAEPEGLFAATDDYEDYYWFPKCYAQADFREAAAKVYEEEFLPLLQVLLGTRRADESTGDVRALSEYADMISASAAMNFTRWRIFNSDEFPIKTGADFGENIAYLRDFIAERTAYLNREWLGMEAGADTDAEQGDDLDENFTVTD